MPAMFIIGRPWELRMPGMSILDGWLDFELWSHGGQLFFHFNNRQHLGVCIS